jgi:hypothetical protein
VFVLASTLDTEGSRNYIPNFDGKTIDRYKALGMVEVSFALTKWNKILSHDFGPIPLGCDVLLGLLLKVPSEIEHLGGIHLAEVMERFAAAEESSRLQKVMDGLTEQVKRHHRWRVWRTSILLCA